MLLRKVSLVLIPLVLMGCAQSPQPADLILTGARVYTFAWPDPAGDGAPHERAPYSQGVWQPDAQAVAVREGRVVFVGGSDEADRWQGPSTTVVDLDGAVVLPGLIESHVHIAELGAALDQVDLVDVETEEEAVERVAQRAARTPPGEWIIGWGWDEGAWADRYPGMDLLSERVPEHPVYLKGLHGFAVWGNALAFQRAGLTRQTKAPNGGEILRGGRGNPSGVLLNRARTLLESAIPAPDLARRKQHVRRGLEALAQAGYTSAHEAGADAALMEVFQSLAREDALPIRVYAMLSARDADLLDAWREKGPDSDFSDGLAVRSVKAYYDGALGSRGAKLLEDYSDRPGHRGVSGDEYGFDEPRVAAMMEAGFQVGIHAIGDAANRAVLDFIAQAGPPPPSGRAGSAGGRHRIEHAQVVHPDDIPRFAELGVIASMQPPHAVEDKAWAEERVGTQRIRGAYAWRSLRRTGARIIFNSDLPGSDYDFFYGLHAAVTRRGKDRQPPGGWHPGEALTVEETLRAYTSWAAYAAFHEDSAGIIAVDRPADLTVIDIDPFQAAASDPDKLLQGQVVYTVVGGRLIRPAEARNSGTEH